MHFVVRHCLALASCLVAASATAGCSAESTEGETAGSESAVRNGTLSNDPWYALMMMPGSHNEFCSGALIAPKVVLMSAGCVPSNGEAPGKVMFPAMMRTQKIVKFVRFRDERGRAQDGLTNSGETAANEHDVAVAILHRAVQLESYPTRAISRVVPNTQVQVVGAGENSASTKRSSADDWESGGPLLGHVRDSSGRGYAEFSESGAPVVLAGTSDIVAIVRTRADTRPYVDAMYPIDASACWIARQVEANGREGPQVGGHAPTLSDFCPNVGTPNGR